MTPPTLHTERLTLRLPEMADFPHYQAFWTSDRSMGMGGPHGTEKAWHWFCHDVALWSLLGHGGMTIVRKADGAVLGNTGINHGPLFPETEIGWFLLDGFEGQGYMTEAAGALRDWAFGTLGLPTLVSYVSPSNTASARVARRLGAVIDPTVPGYSPDDHVYRHPAPQAQS